MMNITAPDIGQDRSRAVLEALRVAVRRIERGSHAMNTAAVVPFDLPVLDAALPEGGIARGRLHEIAAGDMTGTAATGFATLILGRLNAGNGWVSWCRCAQPNGRRLHPQGLTEFGLEPDRLMVVRTNDTTATLWAAEECLRSGALSATLIEVVAPPPAALRRLQLAAEEGGGTALLLRPIGAPPLPATALTHWKVAAASGNGHHPRWRIELRARGGMPGAWLAEWRGLRENQSDEASGLAVVADLRHRLGEADEHSIKRRAVG